VACSDGRTRASAAVDILQAGGYTNAVGRGVNRQWLVVYVVVQGKR
jgi:hypothetical protein